MKRQKIGIDIDDVLAQSAEGFTAYSNQRWRQRLRSEDYTEDWAKFWGVPLEEALRRSEEIHSTGLFGKYRHFEQAVPILTRLAEERDLIIITSRRIVLKPETNIWIERYFPGLFKEIHYAGIWDSSADTYLKLKHTKAELCHELGVDYLIDDQPKHCIAASQAGIKAILFGDYPWNQATSLSGGVTRCIDWAAVEEYFNE